MKLTKEQIEKALASLEALVDADGETVSKASEQDLDQPEGADMGNPVKEKMSDAAKAKKAKKSEAEDEDEEEEEGEKMEKKYKKSFSEELPEEIETKIDVSEFLKSLVDHTGECIDGLRAYVAKSDMNHEARYEGLNEAVEGLQKSQAKIGVVLKAICEKIGVLEAAPAHAPKSETVAKSEAAKPAEKTFKSGLEADKGEEKIFKSLSDNPAIAKSQISNAICDLVKKGEALDLDVIGFESNNYLRPEIAAKLKTVL